MSASTNQLPLELLALIFNHVKKPSSDPVKSDPSIFSCLLCCKQWHKVALQAIYQDVVLQNHNFVSFIRCIFRPDALKRVRSLTVSLNAMATLQGLPTIVSEEEEFTMVKELLSPLENLPAVLAQMTNLATFSLSITLFGQYTPHKDTVGLILSALPESCINLELDLDSKFNDAGTGLAHVCEAIRDLLPQLHHLRLNIGTLCPGLFSPNFAMDGSIKDETHFQAPIYKSLKSLVINCDVTGNTRTCKEDRAPHYMCGPFARPSLVKSLRALFRHGSFQKAQRLWVLDRQDRDETDNSVYNAWNRRDIINNKTWKLPWEYLPTGRNKAVGVCLITRTPEEEWITTNRKAHAFIAEAQTWKETITGSRLPEQELKPTGSVEGKHAAKSPAISLSEYREISPKGSCGFWSGERKTGIRLIGAEERGGLEDTSPIREMTPPGWKREIDDEDGTILGLVRDSNSEP